MAAMVRTCSLLLPILLLLTCERISYYADGSSDFKTTFEKQPLQCLIDVGNTMYYYFQVDKTIPLQKYNFKLLNSKGGNIKSVTTCKVDTLNRILCESSSKNYMGRIEASLNNIKFLSKDRFVFDYENECGCLDYPPGPLIRINKEISNNYSILWNPSYYKLHNLSVSIGDQNIKKTCSENSPCEINNIDPCSIAKVCINFKNNQCKNPVLICRKISYEQFVSGVDNLVCIIAKKSINISWNNLDLETPISYNVAILKNNITWWNETTERSIYNHTGQFSPTKVAYSTEVRACLSCGVCVNASKVSCSNSDNDINHNQTASLNTSRILPILPQKSAGKVIPIILVSVFILIIVIIGLVFYYKSKNDTESRQSKASIANKDEDIGPRETHIYEEIENFQSDYDKVLPNTKKRDNYVLNQTEDILETRNSMESKAGYSL